MAKTKLIVGVNDLATIHPDLAEEWDFEKNTLKPTDVTEWSGREIWWKCKNGHNWQAQVSHRVREKSRENGCPYCNNRKAFAGYNDLATTHPDLAREWDYEKNEITPLNVTAGCSKKVWWKCEKCGKNWQTKVFYRTQGHGCPSCARIKAAMKKSMPKNFNDSLAGKYPELAKEWDYDKNDITPLEIRAGSGRKFWWKCRRCNKSLQSTITNRLLNKSCACCKRSGREVLQGFNDLATVSPDLAEEWDYEKNILKPTEVTRCSEKKVWWKCKNGHSWQALIYNRTRGRNCPFCKNKKTLEGYNDLTTTNPELVKEWNYEKNDIKPTEVSKGSNRKVWWTCSKCGFIWSAIVASRTNGTGCPKCKNIKLKAPRKRQIREDR